MAKRAQNTLSVEKPLIKKGPAPAKRCRGQKYRVIYNAVAALQPGEWFVWECPPTFFVETVKRWGRMLGRKDIVGYRDIDGNVIVRRRGDEDFIEEEDETEPERVSEFGGDDDDEDEIE
jgi:hypothetical protein